MFKIIMDYFILDAWVRLLFFVCGILIGDLAFWSI